MGQWEPIQIIALNLEADASFFRFTEFLHELLPAISSHTMQPGVAYEPRKNEAVLLIQREVLFT